MTAPTRVFNVPVLTESPRRYVLTRHHVIAHSELQATLGKTFGDLYGRAGQAGAVPAGPPFVIYRDESNPNVRWDMDVCVPVSGPVPAMGDIDYIEMPASSVVSLLHIGPYDTLGETYDAIDRFLTDNELMVSGPPREFYLSGPDVPPEQIQTLVERPVL